MNIPAARKAGDVDPAVARPRVASSMARGASLHIDMPASMTSHTSTKASTSSRPSRMGKDRERSSRPRDKHSLALRSIRDFLRGRSSYDVLPVSFRLVVLDTKLVVKPALDVMWQAGVVSAPLWQSTPPQLLGGSPGESGADSDHETSDNFDGTQLSKASSEPASEGYAPKVPAEDGQAESSATDASNASTSARSDEGTRQAALTASATDAEASEGRVSPKAQPLPATTEVSTAPAASTSANGKEDTVKKRYPESGFAGMLTVNDIIHLIQYYYQNSSYDSAAEDVEKFRLERLRDIEQALNVPPPPLLSVHPLRPVYEACQLLIRTHARRLPLLDYDEQTGMESVVSVLTQYRVLKFIAMNCRETASLWRSLRSLGIGTFAQSYKASRSRTSGSGTASHRGSDASEPGLVKSDHAAALAMSEIEPPTELESSVVTSPEGELGGAQVGNESQKRTLSASTTVSASGATDPLASSSASGSAGSAIDPYYPIATATLDTTVFDVVHIFSERGISAVPILDEEGFVVDLYETVDVITLVRTGAYTALDLTIRQALERRPPDFGGIWTCSPDDSLANIFALLRKRRVHRWLILEPETGDPKAATGTAGTKATSQTASARDELDEFAEELEEELDEAAAERKRREAIINDVTISLDDRLEQGDPVRRTRGKLVGILCLSDILKYVIGTQSVHSPGSTGSGLGPNSEDPARRTSSMSRSRGASTASSVAAIGAAAAASAAAPSGKSRRSSSAGASSLGAASGGAAAGGHSGFESVVEDAQVEQKAEEAAATEGEEAS